MTAFKWCPAVCPGCGDPVQPVRAEADEPEPWVSIYPCWDCEHPEAAEAERRMWEEADRRIMDLVARGEILDAAGNPIEAITVLQLGGGKYETHRYAMDASGVLVEVGE